MGCAIHKDFQSAFFDKPAHLQQRSSLNVKLFKHFDTFYDFWIYVSSPSKDMRWYTHVCCQLLYSTISDKSEAYWATFIRTLLVDWYWEPRMEWHSDNILEKSIPYQCA